MKKKVINLIEQGKFAEIKNQLVEMNVVDVAYLIEGLDKRKCWLYSEYYQTFPQEFSRIFQPTSKIYS